MASHYVDIKVVPDPETTAPQLMGGLYGRLHLALVEKKPNRIGVSFPGYSSNPKGVGAVMRLHGSQACLVALMQQDWLKGMRDHVRLTEVLPVPPDVSHRTVSRKQFKTNADRLRRRRMRRKGETAEEVQVAIPRTVERKPNLPYVHIKSRSTKQSFCLFIALGLKEKVAVDGVFNSYGLSDEATIPWF